MTRSASTLQVAPGSVVVVRDEEWLVTGVEQSADGALITVQGLTELVRDSQAMFYEDLDEIVVLDPATTQVVADDSPRYRKSRLWLEATIRKTALPIDDDSLETSAGALVDQLDYQRTAVRRALDPDNLRPRILLADAVGLGKTMEIGMILSELVRRGRGDRILIVTPRHVLEQMQHELWTRFALPFVRLDSLGIQKVRQKLPATRNPFSLYRRAIISLDTLKSERYLSYLRKHRWDAVVIDESHNVTNSATQNNRLATTLAPHTDALILASATPHNGKAESFAELIRLLEPSAVQPDGSLVEDEVKRLVVRRHRHSPEVAAVVGADWAERQSPRHILVEASAAENAVADELVRSWLYGQGGSAGSGLFGWTLAKAFLSSPAALIDTCKNRIAKVKTSDPDQAARLTKLIALAQEADQDNGGKYGALKNFLADIGIGRRSDVRVVVFAERIQTLHWLAARLRRDLGLADDQVAILNGQLTDIEQMDIVDQFKQKSSPIRVLVTGDVASEGVNLHLQCHELVHFDIPWSLIRIEQRNGRIDRYGQKHPPGITTLLLQPSNEKFSGDLRILTSLVDKEDQAHRALGDAASLMGKYDVKAEEDAILAVLTGKATLDEVVAQPTDVAAESGITGLMARLMAMGSEPTPAPVAPAATGSALFEEPVDYLREALVQAFIQPEQPPGRDGGGVSWREYASENIVELVPPPDLRRRLDVLPQRYLSERGITDGLKLATSKPKGIALLREALADANGSSWPEAHYLGPLHPVLDWAGDRALGTLGKHQVFAVRSTEAAEVSVLLHGALTNRAGHTVSSVWLQAAFPNPDNTQFCLITTHQSAHALVAAAGITSRMTNAGPILGAESLGGLMSGAVAQAREQMQLTFADAERAAEARVKEWSDRAARWSTDAEALIQRSQIIGRRLSVEQEKELAELRSPARTLVRPLLVVVPAGWTARANRGA